MILVLNLETGLVSPQFHVIFDDEFTTVDYLESTTEPPNWPALCTHALEHSTNEQQHLSYAWLHPDSPIDTTETVLPLQEDDTTAKTSNLSNASSTIPVSEGDATATDPISQRVGGGVTNDNSQPFVNLDTSGLRRSDRIRKNPMTRPYGLMIMALSTFVQSCPRTLGHCYQTRKIPTMTSWTLI